MKERTSIVNECTLLYEVVFVLTESQREKLESGKLREKIESIALDMHILWSVEVNQCEALGLIGRECPPVIDNDIKHQIEIAATNFMSAVDKLELPVNEDVIHFDDNTELGDNTALDFVKELLADLNLPKEDEAHVIGAQILCCGPNSIPFPLPWGKMSHNLLKEMCELYVKAYE